MPTKAQLQAEVIELRQKVRRCESAIDALLETERDNEAKIQRLENDINNYEIRIDELLDKIERLELRKENL